MIQQKGQHKDKEILKQFLAEIQHVNDIEIPKQYKEYPERCTKCLNQHSIHLPHNLVTVLYSEMEFLQDLIYEHIELYYLCDWARRCIKPTGNHQWDFILNGDLKSAYEFLEKERQYFSALRAYGQADIGFDFMQLEHFHDQWLHQMVNVIELSTEQKWNEKITAWVLCRPYQCDNFFEDLWFILRSKLFDRVMLRYREIYPKMMIAINFGTTSEMPSRWQRFQQQYPEQPNTFTNIGKSLIHGMINQIIDRSGNLLQLLEQSHAWILNAQVDEDFRANCLFTLGQFTQKTIELNVNIDSKLFMNKLIAYFYNSGLKSNFTYLLTLMAEDQEYQHQVIEFIERQPKEQKIKCIEILENMKSPWIKTVVMHFSDDLPDLSYIDKYIPEDEQSELMKYKLRRLMEDTSRGFKARLRQIREILAKNDPAFAEEQMIISAYDKHDTLDSVNNIKSEFWVYKILKNYFKCLDEQGIHNLTENFDLEIFRRLHSKSHKQKLIKALAHQMGLSQTFMQYVLDNKN